jgi:uncharacterized protein YkwD
MAKRTMTDWRASRDPMLHFRVETAGGGFDGHSCNQPPLRARSDHHMKLALPRRGLRLLDLRLRTYGITAALGVFTMGGAVPQCAPPPPPPPVVQVSSVQNAVVATVNQHRAQAGRASVVVDGRLTAAARGHSNDLARRQTMTHAGGDGTDAGQRIRNAGYGWSTWAENVAAGQATPADVMSAWLNSPGHRVNMLNGAVVHIGVAATTGSNGVVYWTMVLAAGG